jgi:hypothetical protein
VNKNFGHKQRRDTWFEFFGGPGLYPGSLMCRPAVLRFLPHVQALPEDTVLARAKFICNGNCRRLPPASDIPARLSHRSRNDTRALMLELAEEAPKARRGPYPEPSTPSKAQVSSRYQPSSGSTTTSVSTSVGGSVRRPRSPCQAQLIVCSGIIWRAELTLDRDHS